MANGDIGVGAGLGAAIGSVIPGIGTAIGGAIGALGGFLTGLFGKTTYSAVDADGTVHTFDTQAQRDAYSASYLKSAAFQNLALANTKGPAMQTVSAANLSSAYANLYAAGWATPRSGPVATAPRVLPGGAAVSMPTTGFQPTPPNRAMPGGAKKTAHTQHRIMRQVGHSRRRRA